MFTHSVNLDKILVSPTEDNIELKLPSRSAHQQGNRGGHVPPEEAEPYNGWKFIETPNLTSQSPHRNTHRKTPHRKPIHSCQRSWAIDRGRGRMRVEETKISTIIRIYKNMRIFLVRLFNLFNSIRLLHMDLIVIWYEIRWLMSTWWDRLSSSHWLLRN